MSSAVENRKPAGEPAHSFPTDALCVVCGRVRVGQYPYSRCMCGLRGSVALPSWGLVVRAGAGLAVVGSASARVAKVAWATLVTLRALCVVLAALWREEHIGDSLAWRSLKKRTSSSLTFWEKHSFYIRRDDQHQLYSWMLVSLA